MADYWAEKKARHSETTLVGSWAGETEQLTVVQLAGLMVVSLVASTAAYLVGSRAAKWVLHWAESLAAHSADLRVVPTAK